MKSSRSTPLLGAAAAALGFLGAPSVQAELIYGVTTTAGLFSFDSAAPTAHTTPVAITGIVAGQTLNSIDFRPATGELFAYSLNTTSGASQLYTINLSTAVATPVGTGFTITIGDSTRAGFDFNPTVDRIRLVFGSTGSGTVFNNYRLNPLTGAIAATDTNVAYAASDANAGTVPFVAGAAYTNNVAGATSTTLYAYDYTRDILTTIGGVNGAPSPNTGQMFTIGPSGITANNAGIGFDISASGTGYLAINSNLYTANLATGALTNVGALTGLNVLDISAYIVPEPGTFALVGVAGSALLFARLRRRRA